jgi:FKBP-type peptidyl-prolyl cis-trans isomerase 2
MPLVGRDRTELMKSGHRSVQTIMETSTMEICDTYSIHLSRVEKEVWIKRYDLTKASLMVSVACMTLLGGYSVGAEPLQASSSPSSAAKSVRIVEGSKVILQYVATVPGPTEIDYGNVSKFIQGRHEIFPALEQEVVGKKPGEEKKVELSPAEGFGPHDDGKKMEIPKTLLPPGVEEGDVVQNDLGDFATVAEVTDTTAVLDYNHPLAGKPLVVQLKILTVENP